MGKREALVKVALGQKGTANGRKYVQWYNEVSGRYIALTSAWCAIFVSWCARQAGISEAQIPTCAGCTSWRNAFRRLGIWRGRDDHTPQRGDLILFDWDGDPSASEHVGIVTRADNKYVYTVEGNAGTPGMVREKQYSRKSGNILGYAAWEGQEEVDMTKEDVQEMIDTAVTTAVQGVSASMVTMGEQLRAELTPKVYKTPEDVPDWGRPTVDKLVAAGRLRGNEKGELNLTHDFLRALVVMDRGEQAQ